MDAVSAVLFVVDNLEFGGGERGFLQLVRALAADGWRVAIAGQPGGALEAEARAAGAAFRPLDMRARLAVSTVARLRRIVREGRFDVVHSQGARADFTTRLTLVGLGGVRHVCTVQMPVEGFDVGPARKTLYTALDRLSARRVDRFIVVSRALERLLVDRRGIAPERITLIPNGVELDAAARRGPAPALRDALGAGPDDRLIGAVGRLVWQKGFENLVRAMPAIVRAVPAARLVVIGDGPLREPLQAAARAAGVGDRVTLAGFRRDVTEFLGAVEVVVIPSLREGLPMITLEAMAVGTPVVATAIPGIVEQIDADVDGVLVEPGDAKALAAAVVRVLGDAALRRRLTAAARRKVETGFDVRKTVADTRRVYHELLRPAAERARR